MATKRTKMTAAPAKKAKKSAKSVKTKSRTKAQIEFDRYQARFDPAPAAAVGGSLGSPAPGLRIGSPIPAWGSPPSVAPLQQQMPQLPMTPAVQVDASAVSERLGSTLRLGVELLNASLAGSLRFLDGLTGMTSGVADALWQHGGYPAHGCSCHDPCASECCSYDCCCVMGCDCGCCEPSVGSCC